MTDVRLTALNPEDSKVYPVACNSSGELLTTKDGDINLDVEGNLDVGGSITADGSGSFAGNAFQVGDDAGGSTLRIIQNDTTADALKIGTNSVSNAVVCKSDGSASFAGGVEFGQWINCESVGTFKGSGGSDGNRAVEVKNQANAVTAGINGNGSATFSGKVTADSFDIDALPALP